MQYLNCKILHGGDAFAAFSRDYGIPSPQSTLERIHEKTYIIA